MNYHNVLSDIEQYLKCVEGKEALANFHLTGSGAIAELESKLRNHYGYRYCLATCSATNTLTAVAYVLNLENCEVITSPFNFGSSLGWSKLLKSKIVFADTNEYSLNISPKSARNCISKKTKAIWAVDFGGYPHDMFSIRKLCDEYELLYVSDAAQSLGATIGGKPASSLADVVVTSFTVGKTVFGGEGGAVLTNNYDIYTELLRFTHPYRQKIELGTDNYSEIEPFNLRMNPLGSILAINTFERSLKNLSIRYNDCLKLFNIINNVFDIKCYTDEKQNNSSPSYHHLYCFYDNKKTNMIADINKLLIESNLKFTATDNLPFKPVNSFLKENINAFYNLKNIIYFNHIHHHTPHPAQQFF